MAGLSADGFEIKRFTEIRDELNTKLRNNLQQDIDTSEGSVAGVLNAILADELSDLWELGQGIYDGNDILKAEGAQLDDLALRAGLIRFPSQRTRGFAWFTGDDGVQISTTTRISSLKGDEFRPESNFSINSTKALSLRATISQVIDSQEYQIVVNDTVYTYTSDASATLTEIASGLNTELQAGSGIFTSTLDGDEILISSVDNTATLNITGSTFVSFSEVVTPAIVISVDFGFIVGDALSLVNIDTPVNGWTSVNNNTDLNLGREKETDSELRARILEEFQTTGSGTPSTIVQRMLKIDNVQAANFYENDTWTNDTTLVPNLPPKSYTVTVYDGDSSEIGKAIWETKPAGIQTIGNTSVDITDDFGQTQTVKFSRPTVQYAYVKIVKTLHNEETYPADGDERIKKAILIAGDSYTIGEDISPKRFYGPIYGGVDGIDDLTVSVAISTDNALGMDDVSLTYVETKIAISNSEVSSFATNRMEVS